MTAQSERRPQAELSRASSQAGWEAARDAKKHSIAGSKYPNSAKSRLQSRLFGKNDWTACGGELRRAEQDRPTKETENRPGSLF